MPHVRRMQGKIAVIGEAEVGKTALIHRFILEEFEDAYHHTTGTKVSRVALVLPYGEEEQVELELSIFDLIGQKGFRDMVRETFFHGCQGLLAVCDVTRPDSLTALHDWVPMARVIAGDVPVMLLANKIDLAKKRVVSDEDLRRVAGVYEALVVSTSAKTGEGVNDAFNSLAIQIVENAVRYAQAHRVTEHLADRILRQLVQRGDIGMNKAGFFEAFPGIAYNDLENELRALEKDRLVRLNWQGPADFVAVITPRGRSHAVGPA